jgi:hypothetical protein
MSVVWETELGPSTRQTFTCGHAPALVNPGIRCSLAFLAELVTRGWCILQERVRHLWSAEYDADSQPLAQRAELLRLVSRLR